MAATNHPLLAQADDFLAALLAFEAAIPEPTTETAATDNPSPRDAAPRRGSRGGNFGFVWLPGPSPGSEITHIQWPWDDPTGWTVAHSGD